MSRKSDFIPPELLYAAIVDSSDDAIVSKNLQSIVMSWNKSAERIFGYSAEEIVGQSIAKLFPAGSPERGSADSRAARARRASGPFRNAAPAQGWQIDRRLSDDLADP